MTSSFRIVKIIHEYRVVVNAGSNYSVREDDIFEVYQPGQEITDPETGESLGMLDYVKAKLRVVDVFPKMCVCENRDTKQKSLLMPLSQNWTYEEKMPLKVLTTDISGGYEGIDKKIKVGDLVREST